MKKAVVVAGVLALMLISCSKTILLSDGLSVKKIKVGSSIEMKYDESNNKVLRFESLQGTHYTINASLYTYVIK